MEATREIYWNIGHGVVWPMYLITAAAMGICILGILRRVAIYRQGRSIDRLDHVGARITFLLKNMLGQGRVLLVKGPGITHALFFWGFCLLFAGTLLVMAQADFSQPLFGLVFLKGNFYRLFSLVLDLAGLAATFMLFGLLVRRFIIRPKGLETIADDYLMHGLLLAILVSGFLLEGLRMAATELTVNPALARFSPVGFVTAQMLSGIAGENIPAFHRGIWWLHFLLVSGFIAAIPHTKLRHLFTTPANYLFADLRPKGTMTTLDLEDEGAGEFGVAKVSDLTWKDIFDADACTSCKRCQDRCPAHATEKPLSPMKLVKEIGAASMVSPDVGLIDKIGPDSIWSCTTCRACQEICPAGVEHVNKIVDMRRNLVLMAGEFPGDEVMKGTNNIEVNGNPFGLAFAGRGEWAEDLDIKLLAGGEEADILYFAGCYASFDKRNREVARSFVRICNAAGVRVGILGKEEKCCGEPVRKLGNEYLYQMAAAENIATINGYGVTKIVTTCPHCYNTLSRDYRDLGLQVAVEHHATFIAGLLEQKRLSLKAAPFECTYHDSCYLGRYKGTFQEPRQVLAATGASISEMERTGADSFCCGAGGGRILAEEKIGRRISVERVHMAAAAGTPLLVSNCPFCLTMFEDGIKTGGCEERLQVRDLAEIVAERIVL